jgi:outer membrane protein OmpA-like peptidoglycan-associated protein
MPLLYAIVLLRLIQGSSMSKMPMPKMPMTVPPQSNPPPVRRRSKLRRMLNLIVRMLMLGIGGTVAAFLGMILAELYPAAKDGNVPLVERVKQESEQIWTNIQALPKALQGQSTPAASPIADLPERDRQFLTSDLIQIQTEFQQLGDRTRQIETRLGIPAVDGSLESRLQNLQTAVQVADSNSSTGSNPSTGAAPIAATAQTVAPPASSQELKATLPSDALFGSDQKTLRTEGKLLLDSLVTDLRQYPGATIKIGAYVNRQTDAQSDRRQTTQQAKTIEQYLLQKLGKGYKWFTKGYGDTKPLANGTTPADNQRNRRIEVIVEPKN